MLNIFFISTIENGKNRLKMFEFSNRLIIIGTLFYKEFKLEQKIYDIRKGDESIFF